MHLLLESKGKKTANTPEDSSNVVQASLEVGGSVSDSVIVMGHGNVIHMGLRPTLSQQEEKVDKQSAKRSAIEDIKNYIELGLYSDAYKKCVVLFSKGEDNALINLLAGIAYTLDIGWSKLRDDDLKIIDKHISLAIHGSNIRSTALAILGCVKYEYYHLNKIYDPSSLTLDFIKIELQKNEIAVDKKLLNLITPSEYALGYLNIE